MVAKVTPFLMFQGEAGPALDLYARVIPGAAVEDLRLYGAEGPGPEGQVAMATLTVVGQAFRVTDSPVKHAFSFTPSISIFVDCADEAEQTAVFEALAEGGRVHMPLNNYGFSRRFGWADDRFGVSWQLNLPASWAWRGSRNGIILPL
jgi:predicted 3-demethylubiquinone-9 3-methyltransferase (glyoxalase superfamily)